MADTLFIEDLIKAIRDGQIRIPAFQRGFVWDADLVAHLMDSIYKGYPFGTLLFWRTKEQLKTERNLGPFELPNRDPDYPIDYILDGQQRATSIFGVFQSGLPEIPGADTSWTKIYFDLGAGATAQESRFVCLADKEVDPNRHFPLKILFDSAESRKLTRRLDDGTAEKIDEVYRQFTRAKIPVQTFKTDDKATVAIVFERINRLGVELNTLQLFSAWTWSEDFDLLQQFRDLADELDVVGYKKEVGENSDLLLRCCGAILTNDASPNSIIELKGGDVRKRFKEIASGVKGAVDFLRTQLNVHSASVLPFPPIIIPLSVFFATDKDQSTNPDADQRNTLVWWIWRTFFARRYSKGLEKVNLDIKEIAKLRKGQKHDLGNFPSEVDERFFSDTAFSLSGANTKTFILMLASESPLDFIGGGAIALGQVLRDCNRKEFHHIFPRAYLEKKKVKESEANAIANFCILPRASNNKIGEKAPSEYRALMPADAAQVTEILRCALCPSDIFDDDFVKYRKNRLPILVQKAKYLMGLK